MDLWPYARRNCIQLSYLSCGGEQYQECVRHRGRPEPESDARLLGDPVGIFCYHARFHPLGPEHEFLQRAITAG